MTEQTRHWDLWSVPNLLLWLLFFLVGLAPDPLFYALRDLSGVATQNAFINSPFLLTLGLAFYFAYFTLQRCREGASEAQASARTFQVFCMGLVAFWWLPLEVLLQVKNINAGSISLTTYIKIAVYVAAFLKMFFWYYLLSLVVRYYALGNTQAFARMVCIFPSANQPKQEIVPRPDINYDDLPPEWRVVAPETQKEPAE